MRPVSSHDAMTLLEPHGSRHKLYFGAALTVIVVGILLRLAYSTHLELVGDEAYYWFWSLHPDISYLDKGPMLPYRDTFFHTPDLILVLAGALALNSHLLLVARSFNVACAASLLALISAAAALI